MRTAAIVVWAAVLLWCGIVTGHAQTRVALVVGNSDYRYATRLPNPPNDAADVAAALRRLGFSVTSASNAGFDQMRRALLEFSRTAATVVPENPIRLDSRGETESAHHCN